MRIPLYPFDDQVSKFQQFAWVRLASKLWQKPSKPVKGELVLLVIKILSLGHTVSQVDVGRCQRYPSRMRILRITVKLLCYIDS